MPARPALVERLLAEARAIDDEDRRMCDSIGQHGADLLAELPAGSGILTHCNAGALVSGSGEGTALAVIFELARRGKRPHVWADETRPLLQGARLTMWELQQAGIDATLICDSAAAQVMREGRVQAVITGADRIAANGDTANKIGTYGVATLARAHGIPFYVAAPVTTFDLAIASGREIPIEQRAAEEITQSFGRSSAPAAAAVYNPAFDVTPAELIAAIITDRGVIRRWMKLTFELRSTYPSQSWIDRLSSSSRRSTSAILTEWKQAVTIRFCHPKSKRLLSNSMGGRFQFLVGTVSMS